MTELFYQWYALRIIKNKQPIINFLNNNIGNDVEKIFFVTDVGNDGVERPFMGYVYVKCYPAFLDTVLLQYEKSFGITGPIHEDEIIKMEKYVSNRKITKEVGINVGSKVEFIEGNYIGLIGNVEEVSPNGEIGVKVWFMDTVTKVYDQIKNVELYKGK